MTEAELRALQPGDIIRAKGDAEAMVVTGNYGSYIVAIRTAHVSNAREWDLIAKDRKR